MTFFSLGFFFFLACLLVLYYGCGRFAPKYQWIILLVGSIAFYGISGGWTTLAFMLTTALTTWQGSRMIANLSAQAKEARKAAKGREAKKAVKLQFTKKRRRVLVGVLLINLGILGYLKYWNVILYNFGMAKSTHSLGLLLPLGISFYTFISLGYLIDIYNDKYKIESNFAKFLLFVSWFPQIIQGPINRFDAMRGQLFEQRSPNTYGMRRGLLRLGYGVFKKYAIANVLVGNYQTIFANADEHTLSPVIIIGILLYTAYMYADFSGGIDMVEGVSELFGIEMAPNFRQPYFSTSLAEYWRRWHMSLGAWMKDYVFYPIAVAKPFKDLNRRATKVLGKQIGRTISACIANVIVFTIVGLWHGAEWHFIAWGLFNGTIIALSDLLAPTFDKWATALKVNRKSAPWHIFSIVRTMTIVSIGRYFDCIEDMGKVWLCMRDTVVNLSAFELKWQLANYGVVCPEFYGFIPPALVACCVVFVISFFYERGTDVRAAILSWKFPLRAALYLGMGLVWVFATGFGLTQGEVFLYAFF